jgi:catechol 2,3-dioxygenase-like lactoylglutathione lyase family enzyme
MRKSLWAMLLGTTLLCTQVGTQVGAKPAAGEETGAPPPSLVHEAQGTFIALSVADVAATSRWYHEKLGFRIVKQGEAPNKIAKFALLESEGHILEIVQHTQARPLAEVAPAVKKAHEVHGIFKVGFHVRNLDAVYKAIKERGVAIAYDIIPAKDIDLRTFIIRDNAGNLVQFFGK